MPVKNYKKILQAIPSSFGVYFFQDENENILYIGKAVSLKSRLASYFRGVHENRIEEMLRKAKHIKWQKTDSAIEALIFESHLIRRHKPKYNVRERDDKTFVHIGISNEDFPRVVVIRPTAIAKKYQKSKIKEKEKQYKKIYGPFPSATSAKIALKILRKIFPFRTKCLPFSGRKCFDYHIGLCPGVCVGAISKEEYVKNIRNLILFFKGNKKSVLVKLKKEMQQVAKKQEFEKATKIRNQIYSLEHIRDAAFMREETFGFASSSKIEKFPPRVEAYDISHTAGKLATGSMAVFIHGKIDTSQYRQFRIKTVLEINDPQQIREVLHRRFGHTEWPYPDIILVDGGISQWRAAKSVLQLFQIHIPLIALAKGPTRKGRTLFPREVSKEGSHFWALLTESFPGINISFLEALRDEAHRFAIRYHRKLRRKLF